MYIIYIGFRVTLNNPNPKILYIIYHFIYYILYIYFFYYIIILHYDITCTLYVHYFCLKTCGGPGARRREFRTVGVRGKPGFSANVHVSLSKGMP